MAKRQSLKSLRKSYLSKLTKYEKALEGSWKDVQEKLSSEFERKRSDSIYGRTWEEEKASYEAQKQMLRTMKGPELRRYGLPSVKKFLAERKDIFERGIPYVMGELSERKFQDYIENAIQDGISDEELERLNAEWDMLTPSQKLAFLNSKYNIGPYNYKYEGSSNWREEWKADNMGASPYLARFLDYVKDKINGDTKLNYIRSNDYNIKKAGKGYKKRKKRK